MSKDKLDLLQGTLDLIVLKLLRAGTANGWEIAQNIQLTTKGALEVNYGSIYPALRRLEAGGFVTAKWDTTDNNRRARFYTLTAAGKKRLTEERSEWSRFTAALDLILEAE